MALVLNTATALVLTQSPSRAKLQCGSPIVTIFTQSVNSQTGQKLRPDVGGAREMTVFLPHVRGASGHGLHIANRQNPCTERGSLVSVVCWPDPSKGARTRTRARRERDTPLSVNKQKG